MFERTWFVFVEMSAKVKGTSYKITSAQFSCLHIIHVQEIEHELTKFDRLWQERKFHPKQLNNFREKCSNLLLYTIVPTSEDQDHSTRPEIKL